MSTEEDILTADITTDVYKHKGILTENGRCYLFKAELLRCSNRSVLPDRECKEALEDLKECMHHTKEVLVIV